MRGQPDVDFYPDRVDPRASAEYHRAFAHALVLGKPPQTDSAEGAAIAARLPPSSAESGEEIIKAMDTLHAEEQWLARDVDADARLSAA